MTAPGPGYLRAPGDGRPTRPAPGGDAPRAAGTDGAGALVLVLHTHLPYVEGFDTWPFGEEWLWEAAATCYLPLLELLDRRADAAALTLSVTPVLADQLLAPDVDARLRTFLDDTREDVYAREIDGFLAGGHTAEVASLRTLREVYRDARRAAGPGQGAGAGRGGGARRGGGAERGAGRGDEEADATDRGTGPATGSAEAPPTHGIATRLLGHAAWTSSATHAVLPLLATPRGVDAQLGVGIAAHRRRTGSWAGGLWLPECAYDPALDGALAAHGVRTACVDLTDRLGAGDPAHLRAYATAAGTTLLPLDRTLMDLVWSDGAMPAHAAYRDTHRRTTFQLAPWSNDGRPWDPERARRRARADAAAFVAAAAARVAGGGLATVALDTEFLGHWWLEGIWWLEAVLDEAAAQGLAIVHADAAAARARAVGVAPLPPAARTTTTWGTPRDLWTWSGPQVADLAWQARRAELDVVAAGSGATDRAWRELLALQSSDWAFLRTRGTAGDYPDRRAAGHAERLREELAAPGSLEPALRGLAPDAGERRGAARPQASAAAR